jgi:hypothetical protein
MSQKTSPKSDTRPNPKIPSSDTARAAQAQRAGAPTSEAIARRAYELYLQRGSVSGYEVEDWLQAEAELVAAAATTSATRR